MRFTYIMRDHTVDNPDQRISEDVNSFTSGALTYSMTVLQAIVTAITVFWNPVGDLTLACRKLDRLCAIRHLAGDRHRTPAVVINFNQQRFEADYRFALVHARDNAEAIALYDGARDEAHQLRRRFASVVNNFKLLILWQRHLTFFTAAYDNAAGLVPYFVLGRRLLFRPLSAGRIHPGCIRVFGAAGFAVAGRRPIPGSSPITRRWLIVWLYSRSPVKTPAASSER